MDPLTPEQRAHVESPAVVLVERWLAAVCEAGDCGAAWSLLDDRLQLAQAQSWLCGAGAGALPNRDELAAVLAAGLANGRAAVDIAGWVIAGWRQLLPDFVVRARWILPVVQPVSVDLEAVLVGEAGMEIRVDVPFPLYRFLVRHSPEGLRIAGIGAALPLPGWPPSREPVP